MCVCTFQRLLSGFLLFIYIRCLLFLLVIPPLFFLSLFIYVFSNYILENIIKLQNNDNTSLLSLNSKHFQNKILSIKHSFVHFKILLKSCWLNSKTNLKISIIAVNYLNKLIQNYEISLL